MNGFSLLEPDEPGYLFGAQSLASLHGYRDLDRPGAPLHTFRPPGLSLLLVPLAWLAPLEPVPAKALVLLFALLALVLLVRLAERGRASPWAAVGAVAVFAASPYTLLHATEAMTEIPYLACATAAALVLSRSEGARRRDVALAAALLAFLPLLRTIGVAFVLAAAAWIALDRRRRRFWPAPAAGLVATAAWALRDRLAGGPTYFGAIAHSWSRLGPAGYLARTTDQAVFYATRLAEVLLPGFWPGRPMYERMTVGGVRDLGGLHGLAWVVAGAVVALAALGAWDRRRGDGPLLAIYGVLYLGVLAVYPPRNERLTWPLVPFVWALVPAGLAAAAAGVRRRPWLARAIRGSAVAGAAALACWQGVASAAMVRDNLACLSGGDAFYASRVPPIYFADWRAAGRWLAAHAPRDARVLTRHSDVGFTSGLAQESVRFEELPPSVWRERIARLPARYLVVPTSLYGKFFPLDLLKGDPAYAYRRVYDGRDVAVLEVGPNLSGTVLPPDPPEARLAACRKALAREPRRVDLAVRCAELTAEAGRPDEAVERLAAIVDRGEADVRIVVALAQTLLDAGKNEEALRAFDRAAKLPEADLLEQTIARGRRAASERVAGEGLDKHVRAREGAARARYLMAELRWADAYRALDDALSFERDDPVVMATLGDLMLHVGRNDRAVALYRAAAGRGDRASAAKANALAAALAAEASPASAGAAACVRAAAFFAGEGMPGRALALLEKSAAAFPADRETALRLSQLRRFFGSGA